MNMFLKSLLTVAGTTAISLACSLATADTVAIPVGQQANDKASQTPRSGMTKDAVQRIFGQPVDKLGAVGTPPISSWRYDSYTVYFEYDRVIHSVVEHQAKAQ